MAETNLEQVLAIFLKARDLVGGERLSFLEEACRGDEALRVEMDSLLAADLPGTLAPPRVRGDAGMPGKIGPYTILSLLGEGGMGIVYLAEQTEPIRRRVAIKIVKAGFNNKLVIARFESERQALALMNHPHIAQVFDAGTTAAGENYFVMEFVAGMPITKFADQHRLTIRDRLLLFLQACDAVEHAHKKLIIHRDIKASNVLAYMQDGRPAVKIIDFGIAKALAGGVAEGPSPQTLAGMVLGTYEYMSPEQAAGSSDIDTRTDVYSLGILLYELLAGVRPFDTQKLRNAADLELRRVIREEEPPRPSSRITLLGERSAAILAARQTEARSLTRQLRSELEWIPLMALRKERERRYASPLQLAQDVHNYLESRPLIAGPESNAYRLQKFVAQRKALVLTMAAVVVALLTGITTTTLGFVGQRQLRIQADAERSRAQELAEKERATSASLARETYFMRITLADQRVRTSNFANADELLDACPPVLRQWEWYRLRRLGHLDLDTWAPSSGGEILSLAYSPDGKRLATTCHSHGMVLWDVARGKEIMATGDLPGPVDSVAFSPDGRWVGVGCGDGAVRLYESQDGRLLRTWATGVAVSRGIAFSPDSKLIAAVGAGRVQIYPDLVRIWDTSAAAQGPPVMTLKLPGSASGYFNGPLAFSLDGKLLATAGGNADECVRFWDAKTGQFIRALPGNPHDVQGSMAFSSDGRRLLAGDRRAKTAHIWDVESAKVLITFTGHTGDVWGVAFSPDERFVATSGFDLTARIWDANTGSLIRTFSGFDRWPYSVAFSRDGQQLTTSDAAGQIKFWDAANDPGDRIIRFEGVAVTRLAVHRDARRVAIAAGASVTVWDLETGKLLRRFDDCGCKPYWAGLSVSDRLIAMATPTGIRLCDLETGVVRRELTLDTSSLAAVALNPDGSRLAAAFMDGTMMVWDLTRQSAPLQWRGPTASVERVLAFSPDGRLLAATADEGATIWDPSDGTRILTLAGDKAGGGNTISITFSADGKLLATGRMSGSWQLWDVPSGNLLYNVANAHVAGIDAIAFNNDGSRVATAGRDKRIKVWEVASHREILALDGHDHWVTTLAWTSDGRRIISGSLDHTAHIWDVGPDFKAGSANPSLPSQSMLHSD